MTRILIAGYPRSGKTTMGRMMAEARHIRYREVDELLRAGLEHSEQSRIVAAEWLRDPGDWVIEGVQVPRALRKWFATTSERPADRCIWLARFHESQLATLRPGHRAMAKGVETVWREVLPALIASGCEVETVCR